MCVGMRVSTGEGGGGGVFVGECGGELGGVVVGVCAGVGRGGYACARGTRGRGLGAGPILWGERCSRCYVYGSRWGLLGSSGLVFPHSPLG